MINDVHTDTAGSCMASHSALRDSGDSIINSYMQGSEGRAFKIHEDAHDSDDSRRFQSRTLPTKDSGANNASLGSDNQNECAAEIGYWYGIAEAKK